MEASLLKRKEDLLQQDKIELRKLIENHFSKVERRAEELAVDKMKKLKESNESIEAAATEEKVEDTCEE